MHPQKEYFDFLLVSLIKVLIFFLVKLLIFLSMLFLPSESCEIYFDLRKKTLMKIPFIIRDTER